MIVEHSISRDVVQKCIIVHCFLFLIATDSIPLLISFCSCVCVLQSFVIDLVITITFIAQLYIMFLIYVQYNKNHNIDFLAVERYDIMHLLFLGVQSTGFVSKTVSGPNCLVPKSLLITAIRTK
jgi:hypothetical protein